MKKPLPLPPPPHIRNLFSILAATLLLSATITCAQEPAKPAATDRKIDSHVGDCGKKEGINKARCERHETMAAKCGAVKGDAHFQCDRDYLLANPLDCTKLSGKNRDQCKAEVAAFKTCEANQGRDFMKCVRGTTGESPMGH